MLSIVKFLAPAETSPQASLSLSGGVTSTLSLVGLLECINMYWYLFAVKFLAPALQSPRASLARVVSRAHFVISVYGSAMICTASKV